MPCAAMEVPQAAVSCLRLDGGQNGLVRSGLALSGINAQLMLFFFVFFDINSSCRHWRDRRTPMAGMSPLTFRPRGFLDFGLGVGSGAKM